MPQPILNSGLKKPEWQEALAKLLHHERNNSITLGAFCTSVVELFTKDNVNDIMTLLPHDLSVQMHHYVAKMPPKNSLCLFWPISREAREAIYFYFGK